MSQQFKFEKQTLTKNNPLYSITPEQLVMFQIQQNMKLAKFKSFKSYLKWCECEKIQHASISIKEIANLLDISLRLAEDLSIHWCNTIGGSLVSHAGLWCYYFKTVYEIIK